MTDLDRLESEVDHLGERIEKLSERTMSDRVWDVVLKALVPWSVAMATAVIVHEVRLGVIEATRFTDADGAQQERRIKDELPPLWLKQQVAELRMATDDIKEGQQLIMQRLTVVETKVGNGR